MNATEERAGTVMLVDDEEMVITSLESFLHLETEYRVEGFTSPERALEELEGTGAEVVLADFLMPGMDGITFLKEVRERAPTATRVLLTGYADKENAIRAINEVGLYQYLEKPWDNERLKLVIRNGVERAHLLSDLDEHMSRLAEANSELHDIRRRLVHTFL